MSRGIALLAAVTLTAAGCGNGADGSAISVHVTITVDATQTVTFTLNCRPTSGTLPFASGVCRDIARHPQPLLDPLPARSICLGGPGHDVTVSATDNGKTVSFSGVPDCDWPGGVGLAIYYDAAHRNAHWLALDEHHLGCDDDPTLLAKPTPWPSVFACTHNLWTPRTARLIRIAEQLPPIASIDHGLFPTEIGARACTIPAGGPMPGLRLAGSCGVTVKKVWSTPTVTFVESWPRKGNKHRRAILRMTFLHGKPGPIVHFGVGLPQLWS
ncbi:MAG TPA: hypothetical protein VGN06_12580 [Gaiellaceae bacterium]|jgi:hypothetical protein